MAAIDDLQAALAGYFADVDALIAKAGATPPDDTAALAAITAQVAAAKAKVDAALAPAVAAPAAPAPAATPST